VKVKDKESGEAGYKDRKKASIERANDFLKKNTQDPILVKMFENSVKKADLSDALSMCLDSSF